MWGEWLALIGGVVAIVGQWSPTAYLPLIGGILAVLGAIVAMSSSK
jgi:hypothetical protein